MEKYLEELLDGCKRNDRKSQEILYHTYSKIMYGVCLGYTKNREEAKDVLQEGFIKVFKNIGKYNGTGSLEGWIRRIIVNTSIDYYRAKSNKQIFIDIEDVPETEGEAIIFDKINAKEMLDIINRLPEGAKIVFNLHVVEGYSHVEIANSLGISEGTSKSQFWRAKKLLQQMLNKIYGDNFYTSSMDKK